MGSSVPFNACPALRSPVLSETFQPTSSHNTRILIADDHLLFSEALFVLLSRSQMFEVVGSVNSKEMLIPSLEDNRPAILLLDLGLAQAQDVNLARFIEQSGLTVRTILLAGYLDKIEVGKVLQLGASGVLLKESTGQALVEAIASVMNGATWLDPRGLAGLARQLSEQKSKTAGQRSLPRRFNLTAREMEILLAIVSGFPNAEIAARFSLSSHTVKHHISHIFDKLGVTNRLELALFAIEHQIVKQRQPELPHCASTSLVRTGSS